MSATTKALTILIFSLFYLTGCNGKPIKRNICNKHSEWRDNNGIDSCSYFSDGESCDKILGKLEIKSRLHKGALEKDIFEGGMSHRWFEITKDSISYYKSIDEITDKGSCNCSNGKLKINWENGNNVPKEAIIYFNSPDFVELRYYDYPFSMNTFQYDSTLEQNNPTKIIGIIK